MDIDIEIDPRSDTPRYKQIVKAFLRAIHEGPLKPGDRLPSQAKVAAETGVDVATVRKAFDALRDRYGLIESVPGVGNRVREAPTVRVMSSTRYDETRVALESGTGPVESAFTREHGVSPDEEQVKDCRFDVVPASPLVAELLQIEEDTEVLERYMVKCIGDVPDQIRTSYYPLDKVRGTQMMSPQFQPWPGGVMAELHALGITIVQDCETIDIRMPTPEEVRILQIPDGVPVFVVTRQAFGEDGPVEATLHMILPGHRYRLRYIINLSGAHSEPRKSAAKRRAPKGTAASK